jgi:hypothetical protein
MRIAALVILTSCSQSLGLGPPTESTCPPSSTLSYASFGMPFMASYCTECHASTLPPDQRHGAPLLHDFDTRLGIVGVAEHVDETAAAGPAAVNVFMPAQDPRPTIEERQQLGEWLACGAP